MSEISADDDPLSEAEREVFYGVDSDRAKAIVLPQIVENHLTDMLKAAMRSNAAIANELFQPSGPLGAFGTKTRLAYMWGMIESDIYKDLITINKIRNKFAHHIEITSFDDAPIHEWIKDLKVYSILLAIRDEPPKDDDDDFTTALRSVIDTQMTTMAGAFQECLRLHIYKLIQIEQWVIKATKKPAPKGSLPPGSLPQKS